MAISSSVAWPSVIVKRGPSLVGGRKVAKAEWSDTFGELLSKSEAQVQPWPSQFLAIKLSVIKPI